MKPVDVKSNIYIDCGKETNYKYPKFNIGVKVGISKNKNVFCRGLHSKLVWRRFYDSRS